VHAEAYIGNACKEMERERERRRHASERVREKGEEECDGIENTCRRRVGGGARQRGWWWSSGEAGTQLNLMKSGGLEERTSLQLMTLLMVHTPVL
jgi:hypothetical protein